MRPRTLTLRLMWVAASMIACSPSDTSWETRDASPDVEDDVVADVPTMCDRTPDVPPALTEAFALESRAIQPLPDTIAPESPRPADCEVESKRHEHYFSLLTYLIKHI